MSEPKYINADDAIRHIVDDLTLPEERNDAIFSAQWFISFLEAFPAAPVAMTSRWVWTDDGNRCKRCLKLGDPIPTPYCPNCGAKMDKEEEK